jgi:pimeloyl-ACP methyl ester carboxylesterase
VNGQPYAPARPSRSRFVELRGLRHHLNVWGDASLATSQRPPLVMLHGWMDVGASFQFVVDALAGVEGASRFVVAPDWRGFGHTDRSGSDTYWFPDYLGDLDALLDAPELGLSAAPGIDLLGHSMGGNVAMLYAGLRPARVRRLVNLEGFGMPQTRPEEAPARYARWLDELKAPQALRPYPSLEAVAQRLMANNPRLPADKAAWLARQWSREEAGAKGNSTTWRILADPAHKRVHPVLYRAEEIVSVWRSIRAPLLWVEGELTDVPARWGARYPRQEFEARLAVVSHVERARLPGCGHMLHHDRPDALAEALARFLDT